MVRLTSKDAHYLPTNVPELTPADVEEDLLKAQAIVALAHKVIDQMSAF